MNAVTTKPTRQPPARRLAYSAKYAIPKAANDKTPRTCEGKSRWNGKKKPVMLVKAVVARKNRGPAIRQLLPEEFENPRRTGEDAESRSKHETA